MRSSRRAPLGLMATVIAAAAVTLAVAVPIALGRDSAGGPVTNYLTYVGGKAGKANPKLSPIVIGAINTQGGQVLVGPELDEGRRARRQVRQHVPRRRPGSPLVLSECFTTSAEEDGTKCGQKFANDKRISVVMFGAVAVGNQSFYAALGGKKPIVSGVALLPVDATQKNEFALFGTNDSVLGPWGTFAKTNLHAKTAAVIYPQVPGIDVGAKVEKTSLEDAGITTKLVGFDPNATDLTGPLTAAGRTDRRHRRPAEQRRRLRQRRQDAAAARRAGLEDRLEPALPERRGRGGPGRRSRAVGLRHRLDARRRQVGPGCRPVQQGDGAARASRSSRRTRG